MGSAMDTSCIIDSGSIVWAPCFRKPRTDIRQSGRGEVVIELDGVSHTASYEESSPGSPASLRWDDGDRWTQSRRWCWRRLPHTTDTPVLATTSEATLGTGPSTLQATTSCYCEQMSDAELAESLTATLRKLEDPGDAAGSSLSKSEGCARVSVQVQQKLSTEIDDCACCGSRGGSPKQNCDEAVVFAVDFLWPVFHDHSGSPTECGYPHPSARHCVSRRSSGPVLRSPRCELRPQRSAYRICGSTRSVHPGGLTSHGVLDQSQACPGTSV